MVYRKNVWQYFSTERLPMGTFRAGERRATVYGDVFVGELVCSHDKGGGVDAMWLVCAPDDEKKVLVEVDYRKQRDGNFAITLPDGSTVTVYDPRRG